ncbi:hypothetical protein GALL_442690 [mine drainage metagenome]|uniref:Uncharacterized protein n=1 Tax=mine drainage metagenome TaxID=410659 RepID=A0A1J5Q9C8_9ZZZZ
MRQGVWTQTLDRHVALRGQVQQPLQVGCAQARQGAFEQLFLHPPDAVGAQQRGQRLSRVESMADAQPGADVVGQGPVHQHRRDALGL